MFNRISNHTKWTFAAGAAAGLVALGFVKTKCAHKLAVKGVAGSMMLKDKVLETAANIKEEADDICAEAKETAKSGGCGCSEE